MSSSDEESDRGRHHSFVLHNAAEDGDVELLRELLASQLKGEGEGKIDTDFDPEVRARAQSCEPRPRAEQRSPPDLVSAASPTPLSTPGRLRPLTRRTRRRRTSWSWTSATSTAPRRCTWRC